MICDVSLTPDAIPPDLRDTVVVVMDVLRATTTITYALQNGALSVIPCEEPADAFAVRERIGAESVVLGGERDSVRIPGFDLDNSPLSYTRENIAGKTVVFTTTNGTRALHRAMQGAAKSVLCAAFVNLTAVVERLLQGRPTNVLLACAGSEGEVALEDVLLAGAIAQHLAGAALADAAKAAMLAYQSAAEDLIAAIASSRHAQALARAGFMRDIEVAAQLNVASVVPTVHGSRIVLS